MRRSPAAGVLGGLRVVVTRAARQAGELSQRLEALGADVVELPAIEVVPLSSGPLDDAIGRLVEFDWVVLTSANGVDAFVGRLRERGLPSGATTSPRYAAIGGATARRLAAAGITADLVPERAVAESLLDALVASGVAGRRLLLPVAEAARDILPAGLREAGAIVEVVSVYRTTRPSGIAPDVASALGDGASVVLSFASPSAVRNTAELLGLPIDARVAVACIGPVTAAAARELGMRVDIEAEDHSIPGLVDAIVAWSVARRAEQERPDVVG